MQQRRSVFGNNKCDVSIRASGTLGNDLNVYVIYRGKAISIVLQEKVQDVPQIVVREADLDRIDIEVYLTSFSILFWQDLNSDSFI